MSICRYGVIAILGFSLLDWLGAPGLAQTAAVESRAGAWRTHVLTSGSELRRPPDAAVTQAEIGELRTLAGQRTADALDRINYWDAGSPGYRWSEIARSQGLKRIDRIGPGANYRMMTLLNVAIYDATIRSGEIDPALATALPAPRSPSYPSEHFTSAA